MNAIELFAGVRDGNYHAGGIRCLRLFRLEQTYFTELLADVERLRRTESGSNVADLGHVTNWTRPRGEVIQYSLLNASGKYDDFSADHDHSCFGKRFHGASDYPALARLIDLFPHTINFRINLMGPGAALAPHEEHSVFRSRAGSVALRIRFHLPVVTNTLAELTLDGWAYHLDAGEIYFVNHGCVHWARNGGAESRLHLVWDMLLTREAFEFMFEKASAWPLNRVAEDEQTPPPLRTERVGAYLRLPPIVDRNEIDRIDWCEIQ
ncbi:MAG TPA: aspartyl/asparaginyl beta-hydroxylase domain-containing protein [Blastocatellia bacterium]|nr:aspartyl/asparaginyl beta-hydroxylase domain-containing protein [Blastocatellia bacterium]